MDDDHYYRSPEAIQSLLRYMQEMVYHADRKVQFLLAANAVLAALLLPTTSGVLKNIFSLSGTLLSIGTAVVAFLLVIVIGSSLFFAFLALRPRLEFGQHRSLFYFAHIASRPVDQFVEDFGGLGNTQATADLLRQVHANAQIANQKFANVTVSTDFFLVALILWVVLLVMRMLI